MIRAMRRSRFVSWLAVFVLFTALPASFPTWHDMGDDPYCSPQVVVHDHNAHRLEANDDAPIAPEHCLLCHWVQSLRGATVSSRFVLPASTSARLVRVDVLASTATLTTGSTGRAPPVSVL